jgi:hypothetical protein
VIFTADLSEGGVDAGEGAFLAGKGGLSDVLQVGESAPGGGTFGGFGTSSPDTINDAGDAAVAASLAPFTLPIGSNSGVYRYSHASQELTAVVVPGTTPAPGGGIFQGTAGHPDLNNGGDLVFTGMVPAGIGPGAPIGLGLGIFVADQHDHLSEVVRPGDPAPGGNTFDFAQNPAINDRGDVAFGAHLAEDPRIGLGQDLPVWIFSAESVYFRDGQAGAIQSIAHQGAAIPDSAGGGTFDYAYAPVLNSRGQVLFDAGLAGTSVPFAGSTTDSQAIFLWSDGGLIAIARQGDAMPGGGHLVSAAFAAGEYSLNASGDVAFSAQLDNGDEGIFLWSRGVLTQVARTGTVVPGVGTIASLDQYGTGLPHGYVDLNDRGQVAFAAVLTDGGGALLLATPGADGPGSVAAFRTTGGGALPPATPRGVGNGHAPAVTRSGPVPGAAELSGVVAALVRGDQAQTGLAAVGPTSPRANRGPASGNDAVVVLAQQATTSRAPVLSAAARTFHPSAVDNFFATSRRGRWDDPLA